jgi:hypothetical protein
MVSVMVTFQKEGHRARSGTCATAQIHAGLKSFMSQHHWQRQECTNLRHALFLTEKASEGKICMEYFFAAHHYF